MLWYSLEVSWCSTSNEYSQHNLLWRSKKNFIVIPLLIWSYEFFAQFCFCIIDTNPVTFRQGAGNQCCYNPKGRLMFSSDTFNGSTPDRSHDWGAAPYGTPDYIPSMSHWIHDVVSFYHCCLWVEYGSCDHYMDLRSTKDCTGYTPPMPGIKYILYCICPK